MQPYPSSIPRIERIVEPMVELRPVSIMNLSRAVFASSADGRLWVLKKRMTPGRVLAEAVGWLLCQRLHVPIPQAAAACTPPRIKLPWRWASQFRELQHWGSRGVRREQIGDLSRFAAILVLDAWLGNADRHAQNLVLEQREDPDRLEFMALDFDDAWVGQRHPLRVRVDRRSDVPPPLLFRPPPRDWWAGALPAWIERAQAIRDEDLHTSLAHMAPREVPQGVDALRWTEMILSGESDPSLAADPDTTRSIPRRLPAYPVAANSTEAPRRRLARP